MCDTIVGQVATIRTASWYSRALFVLIAVLCSGAAGAGVTVTVTTTADEFGAGSACSLREALYAVSHAMPFGGCALAGGLFDSINLPAGPYAISRAPIMGNPAAGGAFYIASSVVVNGAGADKTILDGGLIDRVLDIEPSNGSSVDLRGLALRNGLRPDNDPFINNVAGLGIYAHFIGALALTNVVISDCGSVTGSPSALYAVGPAVTLRATTIMRNRALGVALVGTAASDLDNVTISGNASANHTGGLLASGTSGAVALNSSTIAFNTGANVGGLSVNAATVNLRNSIIARNSVIARTQGADCNGAIVSQGYNLIEDTNNCTIGGSTVGNLTAIDPKLAPLFDYGAGIPTHAVFPGSPARNAGNPAVPGSGGAACARTDARGIDRTLNQPCDIGAYEYHADWRVNVLYDKHDANVDGVCEATALGGDCTLRAALDEANGATHFATIEVPDGRYQTALIPTAIANQGGAFAFSSNYPLTIVGAGADQTALDGSQIDAVLTTLGVISVHGVTLTGGSISQYNDAPLLLAGDVLIDRSVVSGNQGLGANGVSAHGRVAFVDSTLSHNVTATKGNCFATHGGGGGALFVQQGALVNLLSTTIGDNESCAPGAAIFNDGGTLTLAFTTIANNATDDPAVIGGGIASDINGGAWYIANSIIADNRDGSGAASDCATTVQVVGHTLLRDTSNCVLGGQAGLVLNGVDPRLTPLLMQGGSTPTIGLLPSSPAHGVLNSASDCVDSDGVEALADQRGDARYVGAGYGANAGKTCDLGAYQGSNTDVIFTDRFE
jgi:CSLREA domain-containing protein